MHNSIIKKSKDFLLRFARARDGVVTVVTALVMLPLIMVTGIGIDYSRVLSARDRLQCSLDGAVLLAISTAADKQDDLARKTFAANWTQAAWIESLVFEVNPDGSLSGTAKANIPTAFGGLISIKTIPVQVRAKAGYVGAGASSASSTKSCLLILDPSASQALLVNSGATINAPACEIDVASQGNPAAIFNSQISLNVSGICVRGTTVIQNGGPVKGLRTGCITPGNPFANALPTVTVGDCTVRDKNYSGAQTLSPGVYCSNFNFNGNGSLTLSSGLYIFKGTRWNLNSGWAIAGKDVTFYFADSNSYIQINSGVSLDLAAPGSGTYANILFFEPKALAKSSFSLNGSAEHKLTGLIYLPSRNVTFNSGLKITSTSITMVFNQAIWDRIDWTLAPGVRSIATASTSTSTSTPSKGQKVLLN